jgi:hypothetical protein
MNALTILATSTGGSALDDMLRLIGIAAIVYAFFAGIKSLIRKPEAPLAPQAPPTPQVQAAPPSPKPPVVPDEGISPEIIAVIAAAVAAVTGKSHRIISIKPMSTSWERAGRQSVLTSHRIR